MMVPVTIYTKSWCGYCASAKELLHKKGAAFEEIDVEAVKDAFQVMVDKSGCRTVPQIFIGTTHVGGCDDLYALDRAGKLDPMLAGSGG